jgi:hypothetical protein
MPVLNVAMEADRQRLPEGRSDPFDETNAQEETIGPDPKVLSKTVERVTERVVNWFNPGEDPLLVDIGMFAAVVMALSGLVSACIDLYRAWR